jgi:hypothetical protein
MARQSWPPERVEAIASWKKKNNATWKEVGKEFGISPAVAQGVYSRHTRKKKKGRGPGLKKRVSKRRGLPEFVDVQASSQGSGKAIVIVCKIDEIAALLREMELRITRVFLETDMRMGFDGLREIAQENKVGLGEGSTVVFLNRRGTKFKVLLQNKYIVYYSNGNHRVPLEALAELPEAFGGTKAEMSAAIRKSLIKRGIRGI